MKKLIFLLFIALSLTACNNDDNSTSEPINCATQDLGITDSLLYKNPTFNWNLSNPDNVWKWYKAGDTLKVWFSGPSGPDEGFINEYSLFAKKGNCLKPIRLKRYLSIFNGTNVPQIYTETKDLNIIIQEYNEDELLKVNFKVINFLDKKGWIDFTPVNNVVIPWQYLQN
jgi:hypothetical protein